MKGEIEGVKAFSVSSEMLHNNTLLAGMAQRGSEREYVSDPDIMRLSTDCSLSERDGKIAQA